MPDHFEKLDFELEAAIVICKPGRNIKAAEADEYIGGLMIMNDMSAKKITNGRNATESWTCQGKKIFQPVIGPMLVTLDELEQYEVPCKENHTGKAWNLGMKCWVNGKQVSEGQHG